MHFFATTFLVFFFVFAAFSGMAEGVRVPPCDLVCSRTWAERNECCRAHGHRGIYSCSGGRAICY